MNDRFRKLVIGKIVILNEPEGIQRQGVMLRDESLRPIVDIGCFTSHETRKLPLSMPCYVFVQPMYSGDYTPEQERLSKGRNPRESINPLNPILQCRAGLTLGYFCFSSENDGVVEFNVVDEDYYITAVYANDGNFAFYNKYVPQLKSAGFKVEISRRR